MKTNIVNRDHFYKWLKSKGYKFDKDKDIWTNPKDGKTVPNENVSKIRKYERDRLSLKKKRNVRYKFRNVF